jgi:uncharacterized protein
VEDRDIATAMEQRDKISERLRELGFTYVAIDLKGYRTGSLNEAPSGSSGL